MRTSRTFMPSLPLHFSRLAAQAAFALLTFTVRALAVDNATDSPDATVFRLPSGSPGNPLTTTGGGTRMLWYPKKGAFRAGTVTTTPGTQWDDASIGLQSFGAGSNVIASGAGSVALGNSATASGNGSVALGNSGTASGTSSTALGSSTIASSFASTALGLSTSATGYYAPFASGWNSTASGAVAHALGYWAVASGTYATATGSNTLASGTSSTAMGASTRADGANATSMGLSTVASSFASVAIGRFNVSAGANPTAWVATDPLFVIGNGISATVPKNALVVLKSGDMGVQGVVRVWGAGDISMSGFTSSPVLPPAK